MTKAKILKEIYIQQIRSQYKWPVLEGEYFALIDLYFSNKLRRDRDNRHKLSMDALQGIVLVDDSQIMCSFVSKLIDKDLPRISIRLVPLADYEISICQANKTK
jgi:crossover junction endodeoxyribonuclease RusA